MPSNNARHTYIDWARGIAVLLMIEAHTFDAWTRTLDRGTAAFRNATILGGFAAPLFLWLAGLSVPLAAARAAARSHSRRDAAAAVGRRGLEIFVLAFLFRLQAFIVSPGSAPVTVFKVDILNIMGPAISAAALLWAVRLSPIPQAIAYGAVATAIAMATPLIRLASSVDLLPVWLQWYVRPAGEFTTFTAFPWTAFVFAGASVGVFIERFATGPRLETRLMAWLAAAGAFVLCVGFVTATRPSIYPQSQFWTTSPTYFAVRVGIMMAVLAGLYALERGLISSGLFVGTFASTWLKPLATLGRHSLFIYWIHVELVYGYASWLWRRQLPVWGSVVAYSVFVGLMYATIPVKGRIRAWYHERGRTPQPATT